MPGSGIILFVLLSFVAAYVQTLTGFAFGLLLMGAIALTGLVPLPEAAVIVSLLTLANALMVLGKGWRDVTAGPFALSLSGAIPLILIGYVLLNLLASSSLAALRLILGLVIIISSLQLIFRPGTREVLSPKPSFVFFGALGGIMGGLFSTAGPPLVYHFYRQPLPHSTIRETLVAVFAINAMFRLVLVTASGEWPPHAMTWALAGLPGVLIATYAARRWPPRLSPAALRRLAFVLLLMSGLSLVLPVLAASGLGNA
jgi:uncharacterized protein